MRKVPAGRLHGIHTERALENFQLLGRPIHTSLARALGAVKLAAVRTNRSLGFLPDEVATALEQAATELMNGSLAHTIVVDALQGGAGTSANMNVNEVLANRALELLGLERGNYATVSPLDHVNLHQSTNDVFPTALRGGRPLGAAPPRAGGRGAAGVLPGEGARLRPRGEGGAHRDAGRGADDARPGDVGVRGGAATATGGG